MRENPVSHAHIRVIDGNCKFITWHVMFLNYATYTAKTAINRTGYGF